MRRKKQKGPKKYLPPKKKLYTEKFTETATLYLSAENWKIINRCIFGYLKVVHPSRSIDFENLEVLYVMFAEAQRKRIENTHDFKNWLASIYISFEHPIVHKRSKYLDNPTGKPSITPIVRPKKRVEPKDKKNATKEVHLSTQYLTYITSPAWRKKRTEALAHHGKKCSKCPMKTHLQVHHLSYKNLGNEPMEDLCILCKGCHQKEHGRKFD